MLSAQDKESIVTAVKRVEATTGGEIVVSVTGRSGDYPVAQWRAAVFFFLGFLAVILIVRPFASDWVPVLIGQDLHVVVLGLLIGVVGGIATKRIPMLQRAFVLEREFSQAVTSLASEAFIAEEVFATKRRNGILIFVSGLERMFEILADSGVDSQIDAQRWVAVVDMMIRKQKEAGLTSAILLGVDACGDILAEGLPSSSGDNNELADEVRGSE